MAIKFLEEAKFDDRIEIVDNHGGSARNITLRTTSTQFTIADELIGAVFLKFIAADFNLQLGDIDGQVNETYINIDDVNEEIEIGNTNTAVKAEGAVTAGTLKINSVVNQGSTGTKFLVLDPSNFVDFRTGSEVRGDIGAGTMSSFFVTGDSGTTQTIGNGNTLDIEGGNEISTVAGATDKVTINLNTGGAGAGTYGSTSDGTKIDTITLDAYGRVTAVATGGTGSGSMSSFTLTADSGTNQSITDGNTLDIAGGTNISTVVGATDTVTINMDTGGIGSGTYGSTSDGTKIDTITVDAYGRVTAVATGSTGTGTVTGSGSSGRVAFWTSGSALGSDVNFHYDSTTERLALSSGSGTPSGQIELGQNGDDLKIDIVGETGGKPQIKFSTGSTPRGTITATSSGDFSMISSGVLSLGANGATKASIATNGNFTIDNDLNVLGGDLSLTGTTVMSNSATNQYLVIGDVDGNDDIEQIDLVTFGASQMTVMDGEIVVNCGSVNMSSTTNITLGQSSQFRYNSTVSATTNGLFMPTGVGTSQAVNQGNLYAYTALGTWSATGNTSANSERLLAIAAGTNVLDGMLLEGVFESTSHGFDRGQALYIASTAGTLTSTPPTVSGSYARVVGYALNSNYILFKPDNTWVEIS